MPNWYFPLERGKIERRRTHERTCEVLQSLEKTIQRKTNRSTIDNSHDKAGPQAQSTVPLLQSRLEKKHVE